MNKNSKSPDNSDSYIATISSPLGVMRRINPTSTNGRSIEKSGDTSTPTLLNRKDMQEVPVKFTNEIHTAQNNRLFDKDSDWIWLLRKCEKQHFVELDHKDCGEIANIIASKDAEIKELKNYIDKQENVIIAYREIVNNNVNKKNKQIKNCIECQETYKQQLSQCQEDTAREILSYIIDFDCDLEDLQKHIKIKYLKREK